MTNATNKNIIYFQHSPEAIAGDVLDSLTINNNLSEFGKMAYLNAYGNLSIQELELSVSSFSVVNNITTIIPWNSVIISNSEMWTSGDYITIPSTGIYVVNVKVAFSAITATTGAQFVGSRLLSSPDVSGITLRNIAQKFGKQSNVGTVQTSTGFLFAEQGMGVSGTCFQNSGVTLTASASIKINKLPTQLEYIV